MQMAIKTNTFSIVALKRIVLESVNFGDVYFGYIAITNEISFHKYLHLRGHF